MPYSDPEKRKAKAKEYRERNKERLNAYSRDWCKRNPRKRRGHQWKDNNKPQRRYKTLLRKARFPVELTLQEYEAIISQACFYCENRLGGKVVAGSGLDRLNSELPYRADNVVSCCWECNSIKNAFLTPEETRAVVRLLLEMRGK